MNEFDRKALMVGGTLIAAVAVGSVLFFLRGPQLGLLGVFGAVLMVLCFRYPRSGIWLFWLYLPFAGSVTYGIGSVFETRLFRNMLLARVSIDGITYAVWQLAKDALYLPALLGMLWQGSVGQNFIREHRGLAIACGLTLGSGLLTLGLVNLPQEFAGAKGTPFLMGIIGLKVLVFYIPMMLCAQFLLRTTADLDRFFRIQSILVIICCALCCVQLWLLMQGVCPGSTELPGNAALRASLRGRCFVGGALLFNPELKLIRLPGTFASPWQWGWFLIGGCFLVYAGFLRDRKFWRWVHSLAIAMLLIATSISGQRTALVLVPLIFIALMSFTIIRDRWLMLKIMSLSGMALLIVTRLSGISWQLTNLIDRWQAAPPLRFILRQSQSVFLKDLTLIGRGLGRATSAARRLGEIRLIEVFYARILYEIGIVGLIVYAGLIVTVMIVTWRVWHRLQTQRFRSLALCLWLFIAVVSLNTYYYPLAVDPIAVYYWFVVGIILNLSKLEATVQNPALSDGYRVSPEEVSSAEIPTDLRQ
ncbi:MAG: hypothetical protein AAGG02_14080 [Cyanobacteria bacterium P01_H01_bin.15]